MENEVVGRENDEIDFAAGCLAAMRPCAVNFDETKPTEWQIAYMRMVASVAGAIPGHGFGRLAPDGIRCGKGLVEHFVGMECCSRGVTRTRFQGGEGIDEVKYVDGGSERVCVAVCCSDGDSYGTRSGGRFKLEERRTGDFSCLSTTGVLPSVSTDTSTVGLGAAYGVGETDVSRVGKGGRRDCGVDGLGCLQSVVGTSGFKVGVVGGKKKKMGKNQKDRAKARAAGGVGGASWRKPVVEKVKVDVATPVVVENVVAAQVFEKSEARLSLEEKWVEENQVSIAKAKLARAKAEKDLEFQRARDVDAEVRKSRARIMRETESSKVATEKAFASLKASGNVPGFCATVVSDGPGLTDGSSPECTISPDSSASMHEFRAAQKQVLDLQKENADLVRQLRLGKLMLGEEVTFTAKSDGDASEELTKALDALENDRFYVDRSEDPACFGVNKTIYAKRVYIDTHSYDGDY